MAQGEIAAKPGVSRTPKYFSAIRVMDLPQLASTTLAIEVSDSHTPKQAAIPRKPSTKGKPVPLELGMYDRKQLPALTPKSRTKSKSPPSHTPHSTRAGKTTFSFSTRQKSLVGSPRANLTPKSFEKSSLSQGKVRPFPIPKAPIAISSTRLKQGPKAPTPKSRSPRLLKEIVTQVATEPASALPETEADGMQEHLFQTLQALRIIQMLPPVSAEELSAREVKLERRPGYEGKKTIVFDLDETLVHCCDEETNGPPDVRLPITFPSGEQVLAGINVRPYVHECLEAANRDFEVIVFTASHRCYADVVLDFLDPSHELVHHRLYRDDCVLVQGLFVKDLRVLLERDIKKVVIVDNAAYSFGYQLDNGVPIVSWSSNKNDRELLSLIDYMKELAAAEDVRTVNRDTFHLSHFYDECLRELQAKPPSKPRRPKRC